MDTDALAETIFAEVSDEAKTLAVEVTNAMFTKRQGSRRFTKDQLRALLTSTLWKFEKAQEQEQEQEHPEL